MVNSLSPKARVLIELHPNLRFLKLRLVKPTRNKISMESSLVVGFMVKCKEIEVGFRTNPNKSWFLVSIWVITHIRMVFEVIHDRSLN